VECGCPEADGSETKGDNDVFQQIKGNLVEIDFPRIQGRDASAVELFLAENPPSSTDTVVTARPRIPTGMHFSLPLTQGVLDMLSQCVDQALLHLNSLRNISGGVVGSGHLIFLANANLLDASIHLIRVQLECTSGTEDDPKDKSWLSSLAPGSNHHSLFRRREFYFLGTGKTISVVKKFAYCFLEF
jgi:hypothetical protein